MRSSPEFRDARAVIVGASGSGRFELLHAIATRCGGGAPEVVRGGDWKEVRAEVPVRGISVGLRSLDGDCDYSGVQRLLAERADGVIVLMDVSPERLMEGRRVFESLRPDLERGGTPYVVQYHRIEREPRFDIGRMDAWIGFHGPEPPRLTTFSDAPDGPGGAFDLLVGRWIELRS